MAEKDRDNPMHRLVDQFSRPARRDLGCERSTADRAAGTRCAPLRGGSRSGAAARHRTKALGDLRNDAGPVSHGKDGFIEKLSVYHRRAAVLSADAIVAFLHQSYRETELNLLRTREPYERFADQNDLIDKWCGYTATEIDDDGLLSVTLALPGDAPGDAGSLVIDATPSQFLFQLDRTAYIEALNAARSAKAFEETSEGTAA
jgi:hypothetical protein